MAPLTQWAAPYPRSFSHRRGLDSTPLTGSQESSPDPNPVSPKRALTKCPGSHSRLPLFPRTCEIQVIQGHLHLHLSPEPLSKLVKGRHQREGLRHKTGAEPQMSLWAANSSVGCSMRYFCTIRASLVGASVAIPVPAGEGEEGKESGRGWPCWVVGLVCCRWGRLGQSGAWIQDPGATKRSSTYPASSVAFHSPGVGRRPWGEGQGITSAMAGFQSRMQEVHPRADARHEGGRARKVQCQDRGS